MAPLPANNTARLFLDYNDGLNDHTLMWRFNESFSSLSACKDALSAFLTALSPKLYLWTVTGARASEQGSSVSLPTTWTGDATYGTGTLPANQAPRELRWQGRSNTGRRVSFSVYGCNLTTPDDFIIRIDDNPDFDATIAQLILAADVSAWVAIDNNVPLVYQFIDVNYNSYWETQARG